MILVSVVASHRPHTVRAANPRITDHARLFPLPADDVGARKLSVEVVPGKAAPSASADREHVRREIGRNRRGHATCAMNEDALNELIATIEELERLFARAKDNPLAEEWSEMQMRLKELQAQVDRLQSH